MTNIPTTFPIRFVVFDGPDRGKVVATIWRKFANVDWDEVATAAEPFAADRGAAIDIESGSVFPSGKVAAWERVGMRVCPA